MPNFADDALVTEMTPDECWHLLEHAEVGRLAVSVRDEVEIFPLNFVVSERRLYFRTSPGSKLAELTANPRVALEADRYDDIAAASVVVKGIAERLELQRDIDAADELGLQPWIPTLKYRVGADHADAGDADAASPVLRSPTATTSSTEDRRARPAVASYRRGSPRTARAAPAVPAPSPQTRRCRDPRTERMPLTGRMPQTELVRPRSAWHPRPVRSRHPPRPRPCRSSAD